MKKLLSLVAVVFFISSACDKIEDPLKPAILSCGECAASEDDPFVTKQNVLIEEFTGHTCNNCPKAAQEIKDLEAKYPDRVHSIAIHASNFAVPDPNEGYPNDFRTTEGTEIFKFANPIGVPSGLISRLDYNTQSFSKLYGSWANEVDGILQNNTADIGILVDVSMNKDTVCLKASFKALSDLGGKDLRWCAFLTESKIIAPQKLPDNSPDPDYEHSHMLRASLNGTFGSPINNGEFTGALNEVACESRSLVLDNEWEADNCEIVVYVYEEATDSRKVLQVVTASL